MDFAFQNVVKFILRHSKLTISLIRISNVAEDSFHVSIEARTTNTGPASATLSAFTIDLCGPAGCFGQVHLPVITTHSDGAPIIVTEQLVKISDKAALQAFIKPVIVDSRATLVLREGYTTVKALGVGPKPICYEKDIPMSGMLGPRVSVVEASVPAASPPPSGVGGGGAEKEKTAAPLAVKIRVANPSPMEISFGQCVLEIQSEATGEVFAELWGDLDIRCDHFEAQFEARGLNRAVEFGKGAKARLVGKRCMGAGWCDETVKQINTPLIGMRKVFEALDIAYGEEVDGVRDTDEEEELSEKPVAPKVPEEPVKAVSKFWHGRFWRPQVS